MLLWVFGGWENGTVEDNCGVGDAGSCMLVDRFCDSDGWGSFTVGDNWREDGSWTFVVGICRGGWGSFIVEDKSRAGGYWRFVVRFCGGGRGNLMDEDNKPKTLWFQFFT